MRMELNDYGQILGSVQDLCSSAHIAGGAVRDTILQRPIKDIDLFLDDAATEEAARLLRSKFGYVKVGEWMQYELFSDPAVARLAKFENAEEVIPVCLIGLKSSTPWHQNVRRFDFGICMAAWEGHHRLTTYEFDSDAATQTFTLHRADNQPQFNYSMVRFRKLTSERYAGWTLSVPMEFEHVVQQHALRSSHWYSSDYDNGFLMDGPQRLKPKER